MRLMPPENIDEIYDNTSNYIYKLKILYNLAKINPNYLINTKNLIHKLSDYF